MIDYHDFTRPSTPKARREELNIGDIYTNQWQCKHCGDKPRSMNRSDVVPCDCLAIVVSGGSHDKRISGEEHAIDLCVMYDDA